MSFQEERKTIFAGGCVIGLLWILGGILTIVVNLALLAGAVWVVIKILQNMGVL